MFDYFRQLWYLVQVFFPQKSMNLIDSRFTLLSHAHRVSIAKTVSQKFAWLKSNVNQRLRGISFTAEERMITWQKSVVAFLRHDSQLHFWHLFLKRNRKNTAVRLGTGQAWPSITRSLWCLHIDCLLLRVCASCHVPGLTVQRNRTEQWEAQLSDRIDT